MKLYENIVREEFKDYINWEKWDKLVEKTKAEIEEYFNTNKCANRTNSYICYAYNSEGKLVHTYSNLKNCVESLNANAATIKKYIDNQWIYCGCLLSKEALRTDVAFALYRMAIEHGNVYSKEHKTNPVFTYNQNGKLVGAFKSVRTWAEKEHDNKILSSLYNKDKIVNNKLVSLSKYDEEKAKQQYSQTDITIPRNTAKRRKYDVYDSEGNLVKKDCNGEHAARIIGMSKSALNKRAIKYEEFGKNGFLVRRKN